MSRKNRHFIAVELLVIVTVFVSAGVGTSTPVAAQTSDSLITMSLEDLMAVEVTSVSKRAQLVSDSAAAVFVITSEDIRRSTATAVPELLRMVPGLSVARLDAHRWSISARGFSGEFSNKLLVLIDGRSVYTPVFGGVYWNERVYPLHDIERIEVIRGPGAAIWGANAVNGIINIITKTAQETQGGVVAGVVAENERGLDIVRYGATTADGTAYRIYGSGVGRDNYSARFEGGDNFDATSFGQIGFRSDWTSGKDNSYTIQGDLNRGTEGSSNVIPAFDADFSRAIRGTSHLSGGNLLARWQHTIDDQSSFSTQLYYDRTNRDEIFDQHSVDTGDVESQYDLKWSEHHQLISGLGFRMSRVTSERNAVATLDDSEWTQVIASGFLHDEYDVVPDRVKLILGTKLEYNEFTGVDAQPTAQALWTPSHSWTFWGSFSRAIRNPAFSDVGLILPVQAFPSESGLPVVVSIRGNRDVDSEVMNSFQLGARWHINSWADVDTVAFYNKYHDIVQYSAGESAFIGDASGGYISTELVSGNLSSANIYGGEMLVRLQPAKQWQVQAAYSIAVTEEEFDVGVVQIGEGGATSPRNQFFLRSLWSVNESVELDGFLRYVSEITGSNIPSYSELDVRLGWRPTAAWEFAVIAANLLDSSHPEFSPTILSSAPSVVDRTFGGRATFRF